MLNAINQFNASFTRIGQIDAFYLQLAAQVPPVPQSDLEDILRSEIVYSISALDKLVHELVKTGMIQIFMGTRPKTDAYSKFTISLDNHLELSNPITTPAAVILNNIIAASHSHLAFQDPDKINIALNLISSTEHKWATIAQSLGLNDKALRTQLRNIVIRRNQIVHEMDLDLATGNIQAITHADASTSVNFVRIIGQAIYDLVK